MRMSQQKARPTPPPKQPPRITAMVVLGQVFMLSNVDCMVWSWVFVVPVVAGPEDERSIPVQNHFPVFVRIIVWRVRSEDSSEIVLRREVTIDAFRTFPLVGLLRVIVAVEGVRETKRCSEDDGVGCEGFGFVGVRFEAIAEPARDSFLRFKVLEIHSPMSTRASRSTPVLTPIPWKLS